MFSREEKSSLENIALLNLGFRPFFLFGGVFGVISMIIWLFLYAESKIVVLPDILTPMIWHAHEMIFGYSFAIVVGFLLTAVKNWTGIQTVNGGRLALLVLLWLISRILPFTGETISLQFMAISDVLFGLSATLAVVIPVFKSKQKDQIPIIAKILLMSLSNAIFYLAILGYMPVEAIYWGLYSGIYLILSLVMMMGRRVIPFFIEKGIDGNVKVKNWKWVDISSLTVFPFFLVADVFFSHTIWSAVFSAILAVLHSVRLAGWYRNGIWQKPLLWSLYVAYIFIVFGFFLKAIDPMVAVMPWLAIHAFAVGGIGLMTIGMMSRVILGHTGRNVFDPPKILGLVFATITIAAVIRVVFPIFFPDSYSSLIFFAQLFWIVGFSFFVWIYYPMLIRARIDGQFG